MSSRRSYAPPRTHGSTDPHDTLMVAARAVPDRGRSRDTGHESKRPLSQRPKRRRRASRGGAMEARAEAAGTVRIGGDLRVHRLGFGAMRITGADIWGPPRDPAEARRVLKRAVAMGVNFIDTADSYGPGVSEELIAEALHPYPPDLVIATK